MIIKLSLRFFYILCGLIAALFGLAVILNQTGYELNNFALWLLIQLLQPAILIRRWFFEIPSAELEYHYYNTIGAYDYASLAFFYFFICVALAWLWLKIKSNP